MDIISELSIFAALTVANIRRAVQGLEWRRLGGMILEIPDFILDEISKEHTTDDQHEGAVIHSWMLHDPLASWRRLIERLHWCHEDDHANRISHYAEKLTGMYTDSICVQLADYGGVDMLCILWLVFSLCFIIFLRLFFPLDNNLMLLVFYSVSHRVIKLLAYKLLAKYTQCS